MGRPFKCPYCGEEGRTVCKGFRRTKTMGKRHIRLCKACGRKFTPKNQEPDTLPNREEQGQVEEHPQPREAPEPPREAERPREPEEALAQMFPAPDEQWTS